MPDPRTIKSIEERYDLRFNLRGNRRRLAMRAALAVCALAPLAYLATAAVRDDRTIYWSRPVTTSHQFIQNDCGKCHTKHFRPLARMFSPGSGISSVEDHACAACHTESPHDHAPLMVREDVTHCAGCHREHRGRIALARTPDAVCTNCHAALRTSDGSEASFVAQISSLRDHPEFAVLRTGLAADAAPGARHQALAIAEVVEEGGQRKWRDRAQLRFNHAKHLAADGVLMPPSNAESAAAIVRKKLECASCHEEDRDGAYMKPINYERHCAECHPLAFSEKLLGGGPLPHVAPELLRGVMRERLMRYAKENPAAVVGAEAGEPRLPHKRAESSSTAQDRWEWVEREMQRRGADIFQSVGNGCAHCHVVAGGDAESADAAPFAIAPTNVPSRWLGHGKFRHDRHRVLNCDQCHAAAESSRTQDILMPSIDTCRKCHGSADKAALSGTARSDCVQCHEYHHHAVPAQGRALSELAPAGGG